MKEYKVIPITAHLEAELNHLSLSDWELKGLNNTVAVLWRTIPPHALSSLKSRTIQAFQDIPEPAHIR